MSESKYECSSVVLKLMLLSIAVVNMVFTISGGNADITSVDSGSVWKQWVFGFVAYLPFFTQGLQVSYLDGLPDDIPGTPNGVPWTATSYILAAIVGAPVFCWIADKYGRLLPVFAIAGLQLVSWILFLSGSTADNLIAIQAILGLTSSGLFTILPIYVKEISNKDSTRSVMISLMMMMMALGYLGTELLVKTLGVMNMAYLIMGLVIIQLLLVFILKESPAYLAMKGKIELAKTSLSKLKCLKIESPYITKEVSRLKDESDRAKADGPLTLFKIIRTRIWRDATKVGIVLHTVNTVGGTVVFLDHRRVLMISQSGVEEAVSDVAMPCLLVGGSVVAVVCLWLWELKYLQTISYVTMGLALSLLGVYMQTDIVVPEGRLPVAALAVVISGYAVGWCLVYVVMVEILNLEIRAQIIGVLFTYSQLINLLQRHTFVYLENYMGLYTLCYFYAIINIFGAVYTIFGVPETRKRSVKQIEKSLKRIPWWLL